VEFGVSALLRPEIERDRSEFVDERIGQTVLAEVDGFEVRVTGITTLHTNVGELRGGVDRKLGVVFFIAAGTDDAAELPLAETESAEQVAACTVSHRAQHTEPGLAAAERTEQVSVTLELEWNAGAYEFRVGLKKSESEKFAELRRLIRDGPGLVQQVAPGSGRCVAEIVRDLAQTFRGLIFHEREELRKTGQKLGQFWWAGRRRWSLACRSQFQTAIEIVLETRHLNIKRQDLPCETVLSGQSFGAPYALLPDSLSHRPIMRLRDGREQPPLQELIAKYSLSGIDGSRRAAL